MKFADLHLHTIYSDGTYTPAQLVFESRKAGLSAIAVVDHDTVEGLQPVIAIAKEHDTEVLPGIEVSCDYDDVEVHILGYLIDYKNKELKQSLDALKKNRIERIYKIVDKLKAVGIDLNPKTVFDIAGHNIRGLLYAVSDYSAAAD